MDTATAPEAAALQSEAPDSIMPAILARLTDLVRMKQIEMLGPDRIIEFVLMDKWVRLHLPMAQVDLIQRRILATRTFYEAPLLAPMRGMIGPDSVVVDAGANIGNHTVYFALICGARQVHSFEPMNVAFETLKRNVELNGLKNVVLHNAAVGAQEGTASLFRYAERNTGGTMLSLDQPGIYPVRPIDSLQLERLDFIKIDVEGAQIATLEGAAATIERCRPRIWIELRARHEEFDSGKATMEAMGYKVLGNVAQSPNDFLFGPA